MGPEQASIVVVAMLESLRRHPIARWLSPCADIEGGGGRVLLRADGHGTDVPAKRGVMFTAVNIHAAAPQSMKSTAVNSLRRLMSNQQIEGKVGGFEG